MSHSNIFRTSTLSSKRTEKLIVGLNKINLDNKLDLSEDLVANKLVLLDHYVFNGFCHAVANTSDRTKILHSLIRFMKYDVKMAAQYIE